MVRYSKLPFRNLVRLYDVDVAFTPMILADVFKNSIHSRDAEFITNADDIPVIVQFAANNGNDAADAAELVAKYCNGVDINCGCPQPWAIQEGIGSFLLTKPEIVADIVQQVKNRTSVVKMSDGTSFPCSIKVRVDEDIQKTIELCGRAEKMGVDWITVHGRTRKKKNSDSVDWEAIKLVKERLSVPVFANGGVDCLVEANKLQAYTKTDGIMVAQGLLNNPAMFSGYESTPVECVQQFVRLSLELGTNHFIFHHHLMYMLNDSMSKIEKKHFNALGSIPAILDYLDGHYGVEWTNTYEKAKLQAISSEGESESGTAWIEWFLTQRGNEFFCAVEDEYILDRFNLAGLNTEVSHYQLAVDLITDTLEHELDPQSWDIVEKSAKHLYGMIHARWVLTTKGISLMADKMKKKEFGKCPRVLCHDQAVLPVGLSDLPGQKGVKLYCPKCEDVYTPPSKKHTTIDGAFFTTSLPHLVLQAYPTLIPPKNTDRYVPRIYGFRVHSIAEEHRRQDRLREEFEKKRSMMLAEE